MTINLPPDLPSIANRKKQEMLDLLLEEEYGYLPPRPYLVSAETVKTDKKFCAGKAFLEKVMLNCKADFGEFSFPVYLVIPRNADKIPAFIHINFRDLVPDKYQPTEELIDAGFATLTFCYTDVSSDDGDFYKRSCRRRVSGRRAKARRLRKNRAVGLGGDGGDGLRADNSRT